MSKSKQCSMCKGFGLVRGAVKQCDICTKYQLVNCTNCENKQLLGFYIECNKCWGSGETKKNSKLNNNTEA